MIGNNNVPCVHGRLLNEPDFINRCFDLMFSSVDVNLSDTQDELTDYRRNIDLIIHMFGEPQILRLDRSQGVPPAPWLRRPGSDYVGVGMGSEFGTRVGSMMLRPRNPGQFGSDFEIIIDPSDPTNFCLDGRLARTNVIPGTMSGVRVRLLMNDENSDSTATINTASENWFTGVYRIDTREKTRIPPSFWRQMARVWHEEGIRQISSYYLAPGCERIIPFMPRFCFSITSNDQDSCLIEMIGEDYISVDESTGMCTLHFIESSGQLVFGMSIIERIGLFFDYRNNQIGFCEPA